MRKLIELVGRCWNCDRSLNLQSVGEAIALRVNDRNKSPWRRLDQVVDHVHLKLIPAKWQVMDILMDDSIDRLKCVKCSMSLTTSFITFLGASIARRSWKIELAGWANPESLNGVSGCGEGSWPSCWLTSRQQPGNESQHVVALYRSELPMPPVQTQVWHRAVNTRTLRARVFTSV
jgi:hypothetical protein